MHYGYFWKCQKTLRKDTQQRHVSLDLTENTKIKLNWYSQQKVALHQPYNIALNIKNRNDQLINKLLKTGTGRSVIEIGIGYFWVPTYCSEHKPLPVKDVWFSYVLVILNFKSAHYPYYTYNTTVQFGIYKSVNPLSIFYFVTFYMYNN